MTTDQTAGTAGPADGGGSSAGTGAGDPSEEELRAAYEAELARVTSTDMMLQAVVSLLNIAALRMGPAPGSAEGGSAEPERDMEQVRDSIDGVRALLEILERRIPSEVRPLRDGLSRLQMAYARELQDAGGVPAGAPAAPSPPAAGGPATPPGTGAADGKGGEEQPGPAQASGRLWIPGR